jgi:hypothetical protein
MRPTFVCCALLLSLPLLVPATPVQAEPASVSADRAYVDAVLDGLVKAGVLTAGQAAAIKEQASAAAVQAAAASAPVVSTPTPPKPASKKWYDTMKVSGYFQGRWTDYLDDLQKSADANTKVEVGNEFQVRRARTKLEFLPTDDARVEIEADWGDEKPTVKSAFIENTLSPKGWWTRLGQQKVPFGFELVQSSGTRLPFESSNLIRREFPGEYDMGLVALWTRPQDRKLFAAGRSSAWAPGDYGAFSLGVFNGQGSSDKPWGDTQTGDLNDSKHLVARYARPFTWKGDAYAEVGASYFTGSYYSVKAQRDYDDNLLGLHAYLAPDPLGLQAEYYTGETEGDDLQGWYAMGLWRTGPKGTAYLRYDDYEGRRKGNGTSPYDRHRTGMGYAYQVDSKVRLSAQYDLERLDTTGEDNDQLGMQLQVSF